ncbi:CBS domain-containing protein [Thermoactinomyces intermedius]|uniref:CBS domain-containing protein n=1 Tax=Thermoactinomyces intermedius TaxID=2024 RepID=A0A8I1ABC8_THEIN|nr:MULTISPECIES: DRTGG domain-containing protein [Thermoactinomyces]MBA4549457.1 CBS domain-containing protein [Thermoactinomyces intermedius]MBA4836890.1 CBS domain-containing protein [Thermoactinomyces intermedius]MBH8594821.1 CBS domain-containing protein [Thermoactinomyces intermedius]MBH8602300.1 CBS domain-containing protein [Thermoactinomyces sp. CICC 23799]
MATKHEQILKYIESLEVGHKISVRQIAKELNVSDGTAYRAIKDAELKGLVHAIERVGTVRIEKKQRSDIEKLTFAEVVNIVDGSVLGGRSGLHKTLNRMVIGAMKLEAMMRYVEPGNLLIVGNRDNVHRVSLERGSAVLITGGFDTTDEVKRLADKLELPVISSSYDTFTVATMINRAIYDRLIKKEILMVEDVIKTSNRPVYLRANDTISRFHELLRETSHSRYPVTDDKDRVVGMVTAKDVMGFPPEEKIEKVMTKNPITVNLKTSLASAAHEMVWEGIELLPVVDDYRKIIGVISREDVIKSLHYMQKQPQVGETIQELSFRGFSEEGTNGETVFSGQITPQMTDSLGMLSTGVCTTLMTEAAIRALRRKRRGDLTIQNVTLYFLKPVQIESHVKIQPRILDLGRKQAKMDVEMLLDQQVVAKALITAHAIDR